MAWQQIPNIRVWSQGREYVEAAEILLDYNRIHPAAVMAALAIEIFVKSFLAIRLTTGHATTDFGHGLFNLYERIAPNIRTALIQCSIEIDPAVAFEDQLKKHDGIFTKDRYFYEPTAHSSVGSDTVHFARHLCEVVLVFGRKSGV
jgi:hypothetical protein